MGTPEWATYRVRKGADDEAVVGVPAQEDKDDEVGDDLPNGGRDKLSFEKEKAGEEADKKTQTDRIVLVYIRSLVVVGNVVICLSPTPSPLCFSSQGRFFIVVVRMLFG